MNLKLTRFHQRRSNLRQAFSFLEEALLSQAEVRIKNAAVIKAFEMAFELCWKTLKDFLEYKGITVSAPRDAIKEAFKAGFIENGQAWIDLLDHRNELVHVYHEDQAANAKEVIQKKALPCIKQLLIRLDQE